MGLNIPEIVVTTLSIILAWFFYPLIFGAIWQPTPKNIVKKMLLMARVSSSDLLFDLGSGDGRIVITVAREFGAKSVGVEIDPILVLLSRIKIKFHGLEDRTEIIWGNLFRKDLSNATVVTVFLKQSVNNSLKEKFRRELRQGTRIVSYIHTFEGWTPVKSDEEAKIFLYII